MNYIIMGFFLALGVVIFGVISLVGIVALMEFNKWKHQRK